MSAPLSVRSATRRYVGLTALRWLPVGVTIPVTVLLALSRGLTLAQVGVVFLVHSGVVALLELPTGGLADALGRRPVLVASGLLHLASCLAFATAAGLPGFLLGAVLLGAGRALDSGPLQAWYVDTVHASDPGADVVPGLSKAGIADCLALALGAVAGGLLPALLHGSAASLLVLPFVAAAGIDVVSVVAVLLLVTPTGPARHGSALQALRTGVLEVPATVRSSVRLAGRDAALRRVLALSLVCGVALSCLELFGPGLFVALAGGSRTDGSAVFGVVMAVSFGAGAAGAALSPHSRRLARGSTPRAVAGLTLVCALAVAALAGAPTVTLAGAAFACFYLANAAAWPLLHAVLHARVGPGQRATMLSASSLALQAGGGLATLAAPHLAGAGGVGAVYGVLAGVLVLAALLALRLPSMAGGVQAGLPEAPVNY